MNRLVGHASGEFDLAKQKSRREKANSTVNLKSER